MLQQSDIEQLKEKGLSIESVEQQIERFKKGFPSLKIERPATLTDGIVPFSEPMIEHYKNIYSREINNNLDPLKFVPASGAATRMFKSLYQFLEKPESPETLPDDHPVRRFLTQLHKFAFYQQLKRYFKSHDIDKTEVRYSLAREIIQKVLDEDGLNYGFLPKGLILFHRYQDGPRTAMTEHLFEAAQYAKNKNDETKIHFTVSPEHLGYFTKQLNEDKSKAEKSTGASFDVSFSFQKPHTDTIAVNPDNTPFRDENGRLFFRPGGHGSLIENLNDCDAGIIFIKNIDNVVPEHLLQEIVDYKQALAGLALDIRNKVFGYIDRIEEELSIELIIEIRKFMKEFLHTDIPGHLADTSMGEQAAYLLKFLDRPIRVCGMVKNEGEPGGGPFWVRDQFGQETLQIVESSQINLNDPGQKEMFEASTHFNPVDLVCITKNHRGEKFNLSAYIDEETGFISEKSVNGKTIKALERPGLWNGAMANWLTIFVEVPVETFNPVKTVNDLLRPAHQSGNQS
ncbi:DUF4301 family protein [Anaerophaga thermohalophila]|uniref:DUF4301 family protein n=1 Tax=Anaerophaga thermohalophila TaxID=177400 RepID=UPI000237BABB|nr:DUF4301 family protein [Anaerophaga thermohalophila]